MVKKVAYLEQRWYTNGRLVGISTTILSPETLKGENIEQNLNRSCACI